MTDAASRPRQGFTLIELLVVMAIIGILMSVVMGISGAVTQGAAEGKARAELADLQMELEKYRDEKGGYPETLSDLITWYHERYPNTKYTLTDTRDETIPVDPWGRDYLYERNSQFVYFIGSDGPKDDLEEDNITNRNGRL